MPFLRKPKIIDTAAEQARMMKHVGARCFRDPDLTTDGCSSIPDLNFKKCCEIHDYFYRNPNPKISRAYVDQQFRKCMQQKWPGVVMPWVYWAGVRMFGWVAWNKKRKKKKK